MYDRLVTRWPNGFPSSPENFIDKDIEYIIERCMPTSCHVHHDKIPAMLDKLLDIDDAAENSSSDIPKMLWNYMVLLIFRVERDHKIAHKIGFLQQYE